jgi:two-component system OmpR family response regulator
MNEAPKRILVMDDSALVLEMTRFALERVGYAVSTARTLEELEAQRAQEPPDLLLIDVQMPEAYGDDVAMVLRAVRGVNVPILLFSCLDEAELARRAVEAEVDGYVPKRAGIGAVIERIRALLVATGDRTVGNAAR